jgi:hypothetical protein
VGALAYLLTFSTYGTHLPGSEKGWVDEKHCAFGAPILAGNPLREAYWRTHLKEPPWILREQTQRTTLEAILGVCKNRGWFPHGIHVRTTHIHAVVSGGASAERMLSDFKAYATQALRSTRSGNQRRHYWTHHGSTRYIWNEVSLNAAIDYVLNQQGTLMAHYPDQIGSLTLPAPIQ